MRVALLKETDRLEAEGAEEAGDLVADEARHACAIVVRRLWSAPATPCGRNRGRWPACARDTHRPQVGTEVLPFVTYLTIRTSHP